MESRIIVNEDRGLRARQASGSSQPPADRLEWKKLANFSSSGGFMAQTFSDQQLQAYLDELLPAELMAAVEIELRTSEDLRERLVSLVGMREAGVHGLGEIWRRNRLTCPSRQQLGGFLLGAMDENLQKYIQFHLDTVGCRVCRANLDDLKAQQSEQKVDTQLRRRRYFQSSAGYLGKSKP